MNREILDHFCQLFIQFDLFGQKSLIVLFKSSKKCLKCWTIFATYFFRSTYSRVYTVNIRCIIVTSSCHCRSLEPGLKVSYEKWQACYYFNLLNRKGRLKRLVSIS